MCICRGNQGNMKRARLPAKSTGTAGDRDVTGFLCQGYRRISTQPRLKYTKYYKYRRCPGRFPPRSLQIQWKNISDDATPSKDGFGFANNALSQASFTNYFSSFQPRASPHLKARIISRTSRLKLTTCLFKATTSRQRQSRRSESFGDNVPDLIERHADHFLDSICSTSTLHCFPHSLQCTNMLSCCIILKCFAIKSL